MSQAIPQSTTDEAEKQRALSKFPDPHTTSQQYLNNANYHTDEENIRRVYGIPRWDRDRFDWPMVIPNCIEHTWDAGVEEDSGGTDFLARGKPGKGKSTLANYLATRLMEVNNEKVVWRASTSRSEWLPLAPWTRLCLPADVSITARLESKDPTDPSIELDEEDLTEIVREVVYYDNPIHLNRELLKDGQFHVVYPDPLMRGCQDVYDQSDERTYDAPTDRPLFHESDPANHWWFAWFLARVEHGPHHWTTWICDEIGDICPQSAAKDQFGTHQKVELLKDSWVDARKFGLSVFAFAHSETDVHQMIRHKLRWRIQMRGSANPTSKSDIVGFDSIPMITDMTSRMRVGKALMYTETNFEPFAWKDMSAPHDYKLKLKVGV